MDVDNSLARGEQLFESLRAQIAPHEDGYDRDHLNFGKPAKGKVQEYLRMFRLFHEHAAKDASAILFELLRSSTADDDAALDATTYALKKYLASRLAEANRLWRARVVERTPSSGTIEDTRRVREEFQVGLVILEDNLFSANAWVLRDFAARARELLDKRRIDRAQLESARAATAMADYARRTTRLTLWIALFTIASAVGTLMQAFVAYQSGREDSPASSSSIDRAARPIPSDRSPEPAEPRLPML